MQPPNKEAHSCEIPSAAWNLQAAYCSHPAPTFLPIFLLCTRLVEHTQMRCSGPAGGQNGGGKESWSGAATEPLLLSN